jgi:PAS domain S-box-containing protein
MTAAIALIAPSEPLVREAKAVAQRLGRSIRIHEGDLEAGLAAARRAVAHGADVLISRGGTASLIARHLDVPVVEIRVSPHDILRCLRQVKGAPGPIGIVGFSNVIAECESLGDLLDIPLRLIRVESKDDAREKLAAAAREGLRTVIGDAVSVKQAALLGLTGAFIHSGKEAIATAMDEAQTVAAVRQRERERSELLRVVVDSSRDGIVAIDEQGRITLFNPAAAEVFGVAAAEALGASVSQVIPTTELPGILREGRTDFGVLQQVGDKVIVTHRQAVKVGGRSVAAIASFQDVTQLQRLEQIVRQKLHAKGLVARTVLDDLIGDSPAMTRLKERARRFAPVKAAVLISGRTGTGKEMLAQSIHNLSPWAAGPFVAVNCAALPESLLESELFGYVEGAFTGALKGGREGLFELAHGGTIFLDEIGEIPPQVQSRLLRVVQEREVLRVGGGRVVPVDVRIIAATNRHLPGRIAEGAFRADLYYRLAVLKLVIPVLSQRRADIPALVAFFLRKHRHLNPRVRRIQEPAMALLAQHDWPGNVREMEHAIERLLILVDGPDITAGDVRDMFEEADLDVPTGDPVGTELGGTSLADIESRVIAETLVRSGNNMTEAAKRLGIDRSTLRRKLRGGSGLDSSS